MVEFNLKVHPAQRTLYVPKEIVAAFGLRLKARPKSYAMVVYPEGVDLALVLKSLMLIVEDIKLELKTKGDEGHQWEQLR